MTCAQVERWRTAFVDGELTVEGARAVRGHLSTCAACRACIDDERTLRVSLAQLPPVAPPAQWHAIQAALLAAEQADSRRAGIGLRVREWWQAQSLRGRLGLAGGLVAGGLVMTVGVALIARAQQTPSAKSTAHVASAMAPETVAPAPGPSHRDNLDVVDVNDALARAATDAENPRIVALQASISALRPEVDALAATWPPSTRAAWQATLDQHERAIAETEGRAREEALRALWRVLHARAREFVAARSPTAGHGALA